MAGFHPRTYVGGERGQSPEMSEIRSVMQFEHVLILKNEQLYAFVRTEQTGEGSLASNKERRRMPFRFRP